MQLVSAPGGISAHDASFHPILSLILAILRLISDKRCFYKYVYIYIYPMQLVSAPGGISAQSIPLCTYPCCRDRIHRLRPKKDYPKVP